MWWDLCPLPMAPLANADKSHTSDATTLSRLAEKGLSRVSPLAGSFESNLIRSSNWILRRGNARFSFPFG